MPTSIRPPEMWSAVTASFASTRRVAERRRRDERAEPQRRRDRGERRRSSPHASSEPRVARRPRPTGSGRSGTAPRTRAARRPRASATQSSQVDVLLALDHHRESHDQVTVLARRAKHPAARLDTAALCHSAPPCEDSRRDAAELRRGVRRAGAPARVRGRARERAQPSSGPRRWPTPAGCATRSSCSRASRSTPAGRTPTARCATGRSRSTSSRASSPRPSGAAIKRGLAQRIRALNAFVDDVYHAREIVHAGIVPWELIVSRSRFARAAHGIRPPGGVYCHVSGCDLVRDGDGSWKVLEDNVRTPSGHLLRAREPRRDDAPAARAVRLLPRAPGRPLPARCCARR